MMERCNINDVFVKRIRDILRTRNKLDLELFVLVHSNHSLKYSTLIVTMVGLHPLLMLNLSDVVIRQRNGLPRDNSLGVILGNEQGGTLQLINSFELTLLENGSPDLDYLQTRLEQQAVILPQEYLVGVYEISSDEELKPTNATKELQLLLKGYNVDLITLVFNPDFASKKFTNQKFVRIFDSELNELPYDVDTKEAEKVAVDTVLELHETENSDELSKATEQIESQKFILQTMHSKIKLIIDYLNKTDPSKPGFYDTLRQVKSLLSKLQYQQDSQVKTRLIDLETGYNMLISLGVLNENIKTLDSISLDLKKYDNN